ncbi:MAG: FAD-dependent monooxygenase [Synechococcaceae cyanobacterium]|nr:FAD-dependent monooxygenase [Synechococcaceae cyanobacterium]
MLVVGAGPAGAALCLGLARSGIAVTLVEAAEKPGHRFRGEALMPSGLEVLRRLGFWPLPPELPRRSLSGWRFLVQGRPLFTVEEPLGAGPPCTLIDQPALLAAMVDAASREAGFRFLSGTPVTGLLHEGARITGVRLGDGRQLAAPLVVACDGRSSLLRERAELAPGREPSPIDVLWHEIPAASAGELIDRLEGRFVTVIGAEGSCGLFETCRGSVQVGRVVDAGTAPPPPSAGWLGPFAAALGPPRRLPVQVGCAPRWHRPGLLLLGDAAHPMSPVRAQGINMALRDAWVAAEVLTPVLRGPADGDRATALETALERIQRLRLPEIRTIQRLQHRETLRGELLRHRAPLRRLLAATAGWSGPLLARRWVGEQHLLRVGLPLAGSA